VESAYGHLIVAQARLAAGPSGQADRALGAAGRRLAAAGRTSAAARAWRALGDLYVQVGLAMDAIEAYRRALTMVGVPPLADPAEAGPSKAEGPTETTLRN
jgi:hypothetical protein